ncbi:MAG: NifB/NifX family molybdenum-iron cluster-binding protein [Deltaproteobacteria bacterium]|nr:NifB/NifX family molybdenum-iron cluster-binding protein [Deltaproteobacteria bacterium]
MKLAIPVWENKVSPVLDTASRLLVVEVKEDGDLSRFEIFLDERDLSRRCLRIKGIGVDTLICGAVTRHFSDMLKASGIDIIPGISGQPDEVLSACFEGRLAHDKYLMPGWSREGLEEALKEIDLRRFNELRNK